MPAERGWTVTGNWPTNIGLWTSFQEKLMIPDTENFESLKIIARVEGTGAMSLALQKSF